MLRQPGGQKKFLLLILVIVLVVLLMSPQMQRFVIHPIQRPILGIGGHIAAAATSVISGVRNFFSGYVDLVVVHTENQVLKEKVTRLEGEAVRSREAEAENTRLRALLDLKASLPYRLTAARIIGRNPTAGDRTLLIDKGSADGIATDMGVVSPEGIVGRIIRVQRSYAQVLLVTDRNSAVAAELEGSRDQGIVEGAEGGLARIRYLPISSDIRLGEGVVTSGLIGIFPKGMLIGRVARVERRESELFQSIEIVPQVDFGKLEAVLVIMNLPQTPPFPSVEAGPR